MVTDIATLPQEPSNKSLEKLRNTKLKKSEKLDITLLLDVWLEEFFDTTMEEVEKSGKYNDSREFYLAHQVTQEQHDWWEREMKKILPKIMKVTKKFFERQWWLIHVDSSPSVKRENNS